MNYDLRQIVAVWSKQVSPNRMLLTIAIGIAGWIASAIGLWIIHYLTTQLFEQPIATFDRVLLLHIHQCSHPVLDSLLVIITRLGNAIGVLPVSLFTWSVLLWQRAYRSAGLFTIAGLGALALSEGLKVWFAKPRPMLWPTLVHEPTFSFPSSHALGLTVLYGLIANFLMQRYPQRSGLICRFAVFGVLLVGFSRLYLGLHWPTDVLAGWSIGWLWLVTCLTMLRLLNWPPTGTHTESNS